MSSILSGIWRISISLFESNNIKNEKLFRNILSHWCNLRKILNILKKKRIVIANVLPILQTVKDFVRPLSKKHFFRTSFHIQHVKGSQTLVKSSWEHVYHNSSLLWAEMIWKNSPLVKYEVLGVFVSTLTADHKYPFWDCENLPFAIQTQLS